MVRQLTIIIPVYNGERYIGACLGSLLGQLSDQHEVILINDGSTDATNEIIKREFSAYIEQGILIKLSVENGGVSVARNHGLNRARGRYISFVDADDMVSPDYIATLVEAIEKSPDIIEFGFQSVDGDGVAISKARYAHSRFGMHASDEVMNDVYLSGMWYPWIRVFHRELFSDVRFPPGVRFCEDVMAISQVYKKTKLILTLPNILYNYRVNPGGATLNIKPDYLSNLLAFYRQIDSSGGLADRALKVTTAYAMRSCLVKSTDPLGRLPADVEIDIKKLALDLRLYLQGNKRFYIYAIFGQTLYYIRRWFK